jgi:hypothetical protein
VKNLYCLIIIALCFYIQSCEPILNRSTLKTLEGKWELNSKYKYTPNGSINYLFLKNDTSKIEFNFIWKRDFEYITTDPKEYKVEKGSSSVYGKGDTLELKFSKNTCIFTIENLSDSELYLISTDSLPELKEYLKLKK